MSMKWWLPVVILTTSLVLVGTGCTATMPEGNVPSQVTAGNIIFSQQSTGIWVSGEGKVNVVPDVTVLSLGVEVEAKTVSQAQREAAIAMDDIMKVLEENGIDEKDIRTQRFRINPRWNNDRDVILAYQVTNTVTVKIREVDDTGIVIDTVAEAGGDYTRINSISFTVDNPTQYYEEVREMAMADAQARAEQLADLGGVSLGQPTYISEGSVYPVSRDLYYAEAGGAVPAPAPPPTPISAGEMEISLVVQVVYSIR